MIPFSKEIFDGILHMSAIADMILTETTSFNRRRTLIGMMKTKGSFEVTRGKFQIERIERGLTLMFNGVLLRLDSRFIERMGTMKVGLQLIPR